MYQFMMIIYILSYLLSSLNQFQNYLLSSFLNFYPVARLGVIQNLSSHSEFNSESIQIPGRNSHPTLRGNVIRRRITTAMRHRVEPGMTFR